MKNDTITLTRKEIEGARQEATDDPCELFLFRGARSWCPPGESFALCRLCKRLTEFAEGGK